MLTRPRGKFGRGHIEHAHRVALRRPAVDIIADARAAAPATLAAHHANQQEENDA